MKKNNACRNKALIFAVVAIVLLVVGMIALANPISYGSSYYNASMYEGDDFNGTMIFYPDNTLVLSNTTFDEEIKFFYYYKDGYIFISVAETEAEYEAEVAAINEDFEGAVNTPFYASKINLFRMSAEGPDGYKSVYLCQTAIMIAVIVSVLELGLIGFMIAAVKRCKKENAKNA